jgi:hypothetical protein
MTNLRFAIIRDLIVDVRAFDREGATTWAQRARNEVRMLLPARHSMRLDAYGWPTLLRNPVRESDLVPT